MSAKITWSFGVGAWTPIFGDNDHLVTGNRLAVMWVGSLDCDDWESDDDENCVALSHDAEVMQIARETKEIAWSVRIFGNATQKYSDVDAGLTECKGYIQLVDEVTGQKTDRIHFTS